MHCAITRCMLFVAPMIEAENVRVRSACPVFKSLFRPPVQGRSYGYPTKELCKKDARCYDKRIAKHNFKAA